MVLVAGGGSGPIRTNNLARSIAAHSDHQRHAARAETAATPARPSDNTHRTLAQTAASGKPVAAGAAMRQLDQQNGGNRATTNQQVGNQQVGVANMKQAFLWTTSLASPAAPVSRSLDGTSEKDGVSTTTQGTEKVRVTEEGNVTQTQSQKTETKTGDRSWSQKTSVTDTTTNKVYDDKGNPVYGKGEQPVQEIDRKTEVSSQVKVDKTSASAEISGSAQKGNVTVSGSNKVTVDDNGLTKSGEVSAGTDAVKGTVGGGVTLNENGMTASGQAGLQTGWLGVKHQEQFTAGAGSTEHKSTTSGNFSTPQDKVLSVKAEFKYSSSEKLTENPDGSTTFKVTGETKILGGVGVDVKKVEVDASWSQGERSIHTVTVPKGVDVKSIDPTKPESWPEGTRVMIKSEDYKGSSLEVAYAGFGVEGSGESREGTAIVLEKKAGDNVSVAAGPTSGFTNSGKLKFDIGAGFSAELGAENKVDFSFYKTFDLDLAAEGGAQTFANIIGGQKPPEQNVGGVSNLMETTTGNWNYTGSAKLNTPFGAIGPEHKESSNSVWKTYADGHIEYSRTYDANGDGKAELTKTASSKDGENWSDPVYKLTVEVTSEENGELHNAKQMVANDDLKVGDKIEITLTSDDLKELRQRDTAFYTEETETKEVAGRMNDSFADYLARSGGTDATLSKLFRLENSNDAYDFESPQPEINLDHPLPGDVKIISD